MSTAKRVNHKKRLDWLKARRRTLYRVAFEMSAADVTAELEGINAEIRRLESAMNPVRVEVPGDGVHGV